MTSPVLAPLVGVRDRTAVIALAALTLVAVAIVVTGVDPIQDDGYYYLQIARQVARGAGSTFDGLHPTNGYHPLWLLGLLPVFAAFPRAEAAVQAAVWLQGLLLAGATAVTYLAARFELPPAASASAALAFSILALRPALGGLEFALHALTVAASLWAFLAWRAEPTSARAWRLGFLLALAFLARLDNVLLAVLIAAAVFLQGRSRAAVAVLLPVLVAAGAYAAVNLALFGHVLPVSGQAKRLWSASLLAQDPVYQAHGWIAAKLSLLTRLANPTGLAWVAGSAGALALSWAPGGAARVLRPLRAVALFALLQLGVYALVFHGELSFARWYFVAPLLLAALLAAALLAAALLPPAAARTAVVLLAALALGNAVRWRQREGDGRGPTAPLHEAARWMASALPPAARVGSWTAGTVGFESGRTVVNLDGLVNTHAYLEGEQYDQCAYWARAGLTHLVDAFTEQGAPPRPAVVPVALPMARYYAGCAGRLERVWEGQGPAHGSWRLRAYRIQWP
jgi:hypothetical protein